jgi:hypothetical protein
MMDEEEKYKKKRKGEKIRSLMAYSPSRKTGGLTIKSKENCESGSSCAVKGNSQKSNFGKSKYQVKSPVPKTMDTWVKDEEEEVTREVPGEESNVKRTKYEAGRHKDNEEDVDFPLDKESEYRKKIDPDYKSPFPSTPPRKEVTGYTTKHTERQFARGVNPGEGWQKKKAYDKLMKKKKK